MCREAAQLSAPPAGDRPDEVRPGRHGGSCRGRDNPVGWLEERSNPTEPPTKDGAEHMRILFSSLPLPGHSYPLIPLALATRDAGHDVRFATGKTFHRSLAAFSLEAVTAGMDISDAFELANGGPVDHSVVTPELQAELEHLVFAEVLPRAFMADLGPALEELKPDLVVHEIGNTGALVAAERAGIPGVCHNIGRVTGDFGSISIATVVANLASEFGIELPIPAARGGGNLLLDIYPPSLQDKEILAMENRVALRPV